MKGEWVCLPLCLFSTLARGASDEYSVVWRTSTSCAPVSVLHEQIAARGDLTPGEAKPDSTFLFDIRSDDSGYIVAEARLPDGSVRHVKSLECDDVVAALAFIVVVTLDPTEAVAEPPSVDAPPGGFELSEAAREPWRPYAGVTAGISGGRTPGVMPTGGLFLELWRGRSWFARGARLSGVFGWADLGESPESVGATLVQGILEACPIGISIASLCGGAEAGALIIKSGAALANTREVRLSLAGRIGVQLRWSWDDVWLAELAAGALVPLTLDEFVVQQQDGGVRPIHEVNASAFVGISLGRRL